MQNRPRHSVLGTSRDVSRETSRLRLRVTHLANVPSRLHPASRVHGAAGRNGADDDRTGTNTLHETGRPHPTQPRRLRRHEPGSSVHANQAAVPLPAEDQRRPPLHHRARKLRPPSPAKGLSAAR